MIGKEVVLKEMKEMKTGREERGEIVIVKIRSEEIKKRILENKIRLKRKDV